MEARRGHGIDPIELELQMVVVLIHVGAGNSTLVLPEKQLVPSVIEPSLQPHLHSHVHFFKLS